MKKVKALSLLALIIPFSLVNTSCIGSFGLTKKVYEWNRGLDKWLDELVFLVFIILPVYGIAVFIDGVILNSIEFWTGTNPIAMNAGDKEVEMVQGEDGNMYEIAATQNRFDISIVNNGEKAWQYAMVFNPETRTWNFDYEDQSVAIMTLNEDASSVIMHLPGNDVEVALEDTRGYATQLLNTNYALAH